MKRKDLIASYSFKRKAEKECKRKITRARCLDTQRTAEKRENTRFLTKIANLAIDTD